MFSYISGRAPCNVWTISGVQQYTDLRFVSTSLVVNAMVSWLWALALAFVIGFVSIRAWLIERKKRLVAERRVVERPNSFYASKAVHYQEVLMEPYLLRISIPGRT